MSSRTIQINLKINYPVVLLITVVLHFLGMMIRGMEGTSAIKSFASNKNAPQNQPIKVSTRKYDQKQIDYFKTVGARNSKIKDSVYLQKTNSDTKKITADRFTENAGIAFKPTKSKSKRQQALSLSDLSMPKQAEKNIKPVTAQSDRIQRPGTRPQVLPEKTKAINAISLKGSEIKKFLKSADGAGTYAAGGGLDAASVSGDPRAQSLSNSDVMVNLEVPEGVNPDELNKYELMFYGFQRRTAINYVNSFYKRLDKFQVENPHIQFPMTETAQTMTGRITYDEKGNIKQIKMVRWSNVEKLQDFFVEVLKDMDTLHNPPQALWQKSGEFSIFFSLVING